MSKRLTYYATTGTLAGVLIKNLVTKRYGNENLDKIRNLEIGILSVATGQYLISYKMNDSRVQRWRYLDWIITTPMLLKTYHLLAVEKGYEGSFTPVLVANIIMITAGYFAEYPELSPVKLGKYNVLDKSQVRQYWYVISVGAMVTIFMYLAKWHNYLSDRGVDTKPLLYFFYIGWSLYGLNFLNPSESLRQHTFDILDLFNKGVYSLVLEKIIKDQFID